jgi:hypothetical protein
MTNTRTCTFLDPTLKLIVEREVTIPTTAAPDMVALRWASEKIAREERMPMFTIPAHFEKLDERWLTFKMTSSDFSTFLRAWPNRASAEMWMQHAAQKG